MNDRYHYGQTRRGEAERPEIAGRLGMTGRVVWLLAAVLFLALALLALWLYASGRASTGNAPVRAVPALPNAEAAEPSPEPALSDATGYGSESKSESETEPEDIVYYRRRNDRMEIALSFDDGPHPSYTPEILSILAEYGVTATFFMVGENVQYYPEAAEAVLAAGHEVGNHSFDHRRLTGLNESGVRDEVSRCEEALYTLGEYRPRLLRPPEGALNDTVRRVAREGDYRLILWDVDTRDWAHTPPSTITSQVLSSVRSGDIILMHDYIGHDSPTPATLRLLLPALLERGYRFVTVSQLIEG